MFMTVLYFKWKKFKQKIKTNVQASMKNAEAVESGGASEHLSIGLLCTLNSMLVMCCRSAPCLLGMAARVRALAGSWQLATCVIMNVILAVHTCVIVNVTVQLQECVIMNVTLDVHARLIMAPCTFKNVSSWMLPWICIPVSWISPWHVCTCHRGRHRILASGSTWPTPAFPVTAVSPVRPATPLWPAASVIYICHYQHHLPVTPVLPVTPALPLASVLSVIPTLPAMPALLSIPAFAITPGLWHPFFFFMVVCKCASIHKIWFL